MAEVHHFTYGLFNPVAAYLLAFVGSLLGLVCTARARQAPSAGRRARWLVLASISIGGAAIWLMHFTAMLGFDLPASPVRYDVLTTATSLVIAVVTVGIGLFIAGQGRPTAARVVAGGAFAGSGVVAMHYTGMAAMNVAGTIRYDRSLVATSVAIAIVAATVALWFTVTVKGWGSILAAAAVMGVAVCGMHYTAMAAMRITLDADPVTVAGFDPVLFIVPITVLTTATLIGTAISGLQAMTQEEFAAGAGRGQSSPPPRPLQETITEAVTPERPGTPVPWSLREVSQGVTIPKQRVPSPRSRPGVQH